MGMFLKAIKPATAKTPTQKKVNALFFIEKAIIFLEYRTKKQPLKERLFDFIQLKLEQGLVQDLQLSRQCVQYQLINAQGLR